MYLSHNAWLIWVRRPLRPAMLVLPTWELLGKPGVAPGGCGPGGGGSRDRAPAAPPGTPTWGHGCHPAGGGRRRDWLTWCLPRPGPSRQSHLQQHTGGKFCFQPIILCKHRLNGFCFWNRSVGVKQKVLNHYPVCTCMSAAVPMV